MKSSKFSAPRSAFSFLTMVACTLPFLTGCAGMKVQVSIFDPTFKDTTPFLASEVASLTRRAEVALRNRTIDRAAERAADQYTERMMKVLVVDEELVAKEQEAVTRTALKRALMQPMAPRVVAAVKAHRDAVDLAVTARLVETADDAKRRQAFVDAYSKFLEARRLYRAVPELSDEEIAKAVTVVFERVAAAARQPAAKAKVERAGVAAKVAAQAVFDRIAPNNLFDDPVAPLIVAAPEKAWRGKYNYTEGFGSFGNTDIAVIMQEYGSFSLKGVRNDTQKVTEATFHSINLLVSLAAVSAGVPPGAFKALSLGEKGSSNGESSGAAGVSLTGDLTTADSSTAASKAVFRRQRAAATAILSAIVRERKTLETTDDANLDARKQAVGRIKVRFDGSVGELKASRNPSAASGTPTTNTSDNSSNTESN